MASHQVETALLVFAFLAAFMAAVALFAFARVCRMSLDLQERVVVRGTPIVTRVKFGKCHRK